MKAARRRDNNNQIRDGDEDVVVRKCSVSSITHCLTLGVFNAYNQTLGYVTQIVFHLPIQNLGKPHAVFEIFLTASKI